MPQYNITTGLAQLPAGQPDKDFNLIKPLYLSLNALSQAISLSTGNVTYTQSELSEQNQLGTVLTQNLRKIYVLAPSALSYGKMVHLILSGGKIAAEYADSSTNTKPAHGIVNQPLGIAAGEYGEVVLIEGSVRGISGAVFGTYYYLSTNGDVQPVQPTGGGTIRQGVGFGLGTGGFYMHISSHIVQN